MECALISRRVIGTRAFEHRGTFGLGVLGVPVRVFLRKEHRVANFSLMTLSQQVSSSLFVKPVRTVLRKPRDHAISRSVVLWTHHEAVWLFNTVSGSQNVLRNSIFRLPVGINSPDSDGLLTVTYLDRQFRVSMHQSKKAQGVLHLDDYHGASGRGTQTVAFISFDDGDTV
jgi:hypothetical protein